MKYIKGYTFTLTKCGDEAKLSLKTMKSETASDTVVLCFAALMDTAHSETIDFVGEHMPTDSELIEMIKFAQNLGLRVILKPIVNCKNGTWRAHINFFDVDVPCEPKWSNWFASYFEYIIHYAKIAEVTNCEMLIIGCEMVQAQRKEKFWRDLINKVRETYSGLVSYNTDKYQEEHVTWWDAVDVISSSGYYPINDWNNQLNRIESTVKKYCKPFFFAEAGCMSTQGSSFIPNNWELQGSISLNEQAEYFKVMLEKTSKRNWISGFAFWDWQSQLYEKADGVLDSGYSTFGKPSCSIIFNFYNSDMNFNGGI